MPASRRSALTLTVLVLLSYGLVSAFSSGPPAGVSGAPGEANCTACHFQFPANSGPGAVQVGGADYIGAASSVPLSVTIQIPQTPRNGFQMTVRDSGNIGLTGLQGVPPIIQVNGPNHVNHTSVGIMQSSWNTTWSVPAGLPAGPVTVYAAGNATNMDGTFFGDQIYTGSKVVYQNGLTSASTSWSIGQVHPLIMDIRTPGPGFYAMVVAFDTTPTNLIGPFTLPLNPFDPFYPVALGLPNFFQNFLGTFDATGTPLTPPQVWVPPAGSLLGISMSFAYVTFDPALTTLTEVSNRHTITFVP